MKYLIKPQALENNKFCFIMSECECNAGACYTHSCNHICGLDYDIICPEHCVALICAPAKIDPFSL